MGKKSSPPPPPPDPSIGYAQMQQQQIATEQWDDYINNERPYQRELMERQQANADRYQETAERSQNEVMGWGREAHAYGQAQREWGQGQQEKYSQYADQERARWEKDFRPAEDFIVQDAKDYNTDANFEQQAGYASGDIGAAFQQARQQANIRNQSMGINPTSGAAQAGAGGMDAGEAAMRAAAMTRARDGARQLGWDKQMNVAAMGQGVLSNQQAYSQMGQGMGAYALGANEAGLSATAQGLAAGYSGLQAGQMGIGNRIAAQQGGNQTAAGAGGLYQNVGQLGAQQYGIRSGQWSSQNAANGQKAAGTGQAIGAVAGIAIAI